MQHNQMAETSYTSLDRPYDSTLNRKDDLSYVLGDAVIPGSEGGDVEVPIKTGGAFSDIWIKNKITSLNWKPQKIGFMMNGQTGYAEFADVYISGAITATSGNIGGWTISSSFLTGVGGTIRTSNGPQRVEIDSATNSINYYSNNVLRINMGSVGVLSESTSLNFYDYLGALEGSIYGTQEGLILSDGAGCAGSFWVNDNLMMGSGGSIGIIPAYSSSLYLGAADTNSGISGIFMEETVGAVIWLGTMTTTVRDTIAAGPGGLIYNTTLGKMQVYEASSWRTVTTT